MQVEHRGALGRIVKTILHFNRIINKENWCFRLHKYIKLHIFLTINAYNQQLKAESVIDSDDDTAI